MDNKTKKLLYIGGGALLLWYIMQPKGTNQNVSNVLKPQTPSTPQTQLQQTQLQQTNTLISSGANLINSLKSLIPSGSSPVTDLSSNTDLSDYTNLETQAPDINYGNYYNDTFDNSEV